jgi:N,N'-diacetyllegionaminate synthase
MSVYIIAEIGQAHEGSLGIAHSYIDALAKTGVDAIKWQTHIAQAESSIYEPFRVKFSYEDKSRYDYWKRMEFSKSQWVDLKKHCDNVGLEFISSPFSNAAVDLLEEVGVNRYKIGSGEVGNLLLLERVARTGKPTIISSGMSSFEELDQAVNFLSSRVEVSVMQCFTSYPTNPEQWGLNLIPELKERYQTPVGFSDHSGDISACTAAAALGADMLEFHVVFDKRMFGPDSVASLTIDEVSQLVFSVNKIKLSLQSPVQKNVPENLVRVKKMFGKSLAVNKDLVKGHVITFEDLDAKKPSEKGIGADKFASVIGMSLMHDMDAWSFINETDINE